MQRIPMSEVKARHKGHWFERDTMRFFNCELPVKATQTEHGTWFVSAERPSLDVAPLFTIRFQNEKGDIDTIGKHCQFVESSDAREAMRRLMELPLPAAIWNQIDRLAKMDDSALIVVSSNVGADAEDVREALRILA